MLMIDDGVLVLGEVIDVVIGEVVTVLDGVVLVAVVNVYVFLVA